VFNSHASPLSELPHVLLFMDRAWLSLVPVKTAVDLQLLQTKFVVIQLASRNEQLKSSVYRSNCDGSSAT